MSVTHPAGVKSGLADYVVDQLDGGTLVIIQGGDPGTDIATMGFGTPAFGDAASGIATANAISDDTNAAGGVATQAELRKADSSVVVSCSVGGTGSGEDIILSTIAIVPGSTVSITSLQYVSAP